MRFRFPGMSLMEALLAIAIFAVGMLTVGALVIDANVSARKSVERAAALALAKEGLESARAIRDAGYGQLAPGTYGLALAGGRWTLSGASDTHDGFTRTIEIGGAGSHRSVTSTVRWRFSSDFESSVILASGLTNWRRHTTSSWENPVVVVTSTFGAVAAYAVQVSGNKLYVSTPQNPAAPEFYIYDISNEALPVQVGSLEMGFSCFSLGVSGTRAYVASNNNPDEVKIIDVSDSDSPVSLGSIKLTGNQNVNSIAVSGNNVHFVRDEQGNQATYFIYDVAVPALPLLLGSLNLGDSGNDLALRPGSPSFAFFATEDSSQEFKAVNYSTPPIMGVGGGVNLPGIDELVGIAVSGTLAYGGAEQEDQFPEFYTFNITTPTNPSTLGSLRIRGDIRRLEVVDNHIFLATSSSTGQFIVLDVMNPAAPVLVGKKALVGNATDIAMSPSGDYAYVTTDSPSAGLYVITLGRY